MILIHLLILRALGRTPSRLPAVVWAARWLSFLLFPLLAGCSGWTVMPMVIDLETGEIPFREQTGIVSRADRACPAQDERFLDAVVALDASSFRDRVLAAQTLAAGGQPVLAYLDRAAATAADGSHHRSHLLSILQCAMDGLSVDALAAELQHASIERRRAAAHTLAGRGPASVPLLLTCVQDRDVKIRRTAVTGLRALTGLRIVTNKRDFGLPAIVASGPAGVKGVSGRGLRIENGVWNAVFRAESGASTER